MASNVKEITLNIKIHSLYLNDGLSAILHTILFVRAPNVLKATDYKCDVLTPLIFATCGTSDINDTVRL